MMFLPWHLVSAPFGGLPSLFLEGDVSVPLHSFFCYSFYRSILGLPLPACLDLLLKYLNGGVIFFIIIIFNLASKHLSYSIHSCLLKE